MLSQLKTEVREILGHLDIDRIKLTLWIDEVDARTLKFWQEVLEKLKSQPETKQETENHEKEVSTMQGFYGDSIGNYLKPKDAINTSVEMATKILCHYQYRNEIPLNEISILSIETTESELIIEGDILSTIPIRVKISKTDYLNLQKRFETLREIEFTKKEILAYAREHDLTFSWKFDPEFECSFFDSKDRFIGKIFKNHLGWQAQLADSYYVRDFGKNIILGIQYLLGMHETKRKLADILGDFVISKFN